jgi:PilZ domain
MRDRRKVPRYRFAKTAMLYPPGGGVGTKAVVYAISVRGCLVECEKSPAIGKKCELYIDTELAQIGVEAQAVSVDPDGRTGLKFLTVDKESGKRLEELCAGLQMQAVSPPVEETEEAEKPGGETARAPEATWVGVVPPVFAPPARPKTPLRERRQVPRYVSELRASVSHPASGATARVALITLSILGGCLEGADLPGPGEACEVITEWEGRALRLSGKIVWRVKLRAGVKFESLDEATEKLLRQVCASLRLQPLAPLPPEPE